MEQKIHKITFDDISSLDYSQLNKGGSKEERFNPNEFIDLENSQDDEHDAILAKFAPPPRKGSLKPGSVLKSPTTILTNQYKYTPTKVESPKTHFEKLTNADIAGMNPRDANMASARRD